LTDLIDLNSDLQKLLDDWKDLILTLRNNRNTIRQNTILMTKWETKRTSVMNRFERLTSDDRERLNKAYQEWYRKERFS